MTESKHAPAPWRMIERDGRDHISILAADGREIANVHRLFGFYAVQSEANASLIVTAPELLEACQAALQCWRVNADMEYDYAPEIEQLTAAIAKAKGE